MKRVFLLFSLLILLFSASAQKTVYDENAELREGKGFHAIEVSGGIDLYLSAGDEAVAVSTSEVRYKNKIITTVENGVLKINYKWEKGIRGGAKSLKAYVSYKNLDRISGSGASKITVEETIKMPSLDIHISGSSDFKGKVDVAELTVNQSGASDVKIGGIALRLSVAASGASKFSGYDLSAETCTLSASGASDIRTTASKEIFAEATGASDINCRGTAEVKASKTSGSSNIRKS